MKRLKTFGKYLLLFLVVFFLVDFFSNRVMFTRFKPVNNGEVESSSIELNNIECRATKQNGYIEGTVKNKTDAYVNNLTMKVELYNDRDKLVKTEIVEIQDLKIGEEKPFKFFYYEQDVVRYKIINIEYI